MSSLNHMRRREFLVGIGATTATLALSTLLSPRRALALDSVTRLVPSEYQTIQSAIDASSNGDVILVAPGTYFEAIDYKGRNVILKSTGGPNLTVIDATGLDQSVVKIWSDEASAVLEGFTVCGGKGSGSSNPRKGGGIFMSSSSATIRWCIITGNEAHAGAGLAVEGSVVTLQSCEIRANHSLGTSYSGYGGAGFWGHWAAATIENCSFTDNTFVGTLYGGGACFSGGVSSMKNCLVARNTAKYGAGIVAGLAQLTVTNCTIVDNVATHSGGGLHMASSYGLYFVVNSIVWDNSAATSPQVHTTTTAGLTTHTTCIEGGLNHPNATNILTVDPEFRDPAAGDYRLSDSSPLRDVGDNSAMSELPTTDLDGLPRIIGSAVDLGAYEIQNPVPQTTCLGDTNDDSTVNNIDLLNVLNDWGSKSSPADLNGDGIVGNLDLLNVLNNWGQCP